MGWVITGNETPGQIGEEDKKKKKRANAQASFKKGSMWRPDQTSCTHFPGLPGLIRSRRRTTTDHQTRVLLFCLQSDVFSHHLPLDWPLTVKGKKEKKTFRSKVGEVKPGQSLILKIEPEEDFQQRKSPQHNTASS